MQRLSFINWNATIYSKLELSITKLSPILFMVFATIICNAQNQQLKCESTVVVETDELPGYFFGKELFFKSLKEKSAIPLKSKLTKYPVRVKLLVCENGDFEVVEISNHSIETFTTETKRILGLYAKFKPGFKNGIAVTSYMWIQLNFDPKKDFVTPDQIIRISEEQSN